MPYILTVSFFKRNLYITLSNIYGEIRCWWSSGRNRFSGRARTNALAVITVTQNFLWRIRLSRLPAIFLKFRNLRKAKVAVRKAFRLHRKRLRTLKRRNKIPSIPILGIFTELHVSFNGCRGKKLKRKKRRRRTKIIRIKTGKSKKNDSIESFEIQRLNRIKEFQDNIKWSQYDIKNKQKKSNQVPIKKLIKIKIKKTKPINKILIPKIFNENQFDNVSFNKEDPKNKQKNKKEKNRKRIFYKENKKKRTRN